MCVQAWPFLLHESDSPVFKTKKLLVTSPMVSRPWSFLSACWCSRHTLHHRDHIGNYTQRMLANCRSFGLTYLGLQKFCPSRAATRAISATSENKGDITRPPHYKRCFWPPLAFHFHISKWCLICMIQQGYKYFSSSF